MAAYDDILKFWLEETPEEHWYVSDPALDQTIRERFQAQWAETAAGANACWLTHARGALAYVVLTDQFPRNMFRGTAQAFATDELAKAAAKLAIARGWDLEIDPPARQFLYMPVMHSECQSDQDRCIRLLLTRLPGGGADNLLHARAHREVIRMFGRFPYRNAALQRPSRPAEEAYLAAGGYGLTVQQMRAAG